MRTPRHTGRLAAGAAVLLFWAACNKTTPTEPPPVPTPTPLPTPVRTIAPTPTPIVILTPTRTPTPFVPPATPTPGSSLATMTWVIADGCNDGRGLQLRFYDKTNNSVWPNSSQVYVISSGGTQTYTLSVRRGATICYGAQKDPPDSYYWGLGINGDKGCSDCCYTGGDVRVGLNLVCN